MSIQKFFPKLKLMGIFESKNAKKDQKLPFFSDFCLDNFKNLVHFVNFCYNFKTNQHFSIKLEKNASVQPPKPLHSLQPRCPPPSPNFVPLILNFCYNFTIELRSVERFKPDPARPDRNDLCSLINAITPRFLA